ncbi:hypothetical protein PGB90_006134 [Kerria lacca]
MEFIEDNHSEETPNLQKYFQKIPGCAIFSKETEDAEGCNTHLETGLKVSYDETFSVLEKSFEFIENRLALQLKNYSYYESGAVLQSKKGCHVSGSNSTVGPFIQYLTHPPEITLKPKSQQVRSGGVVAFYCAAQGDPNPSLYWKKNGKRVSESHSRYQMMNFTGVGISLLRIETVRSMRDNATYECIAENGVGDAVSSEATLIVHDGTRSLRDKPEGGIELRDIAKM